MLIKPSASILIGVLSVIFLTASFTYPAYADAQAAKKQLCDKCTLICEKEYKKCTNSKSKDVTIPCAKSMTKCIKRCPC